MKYTIFIPGMKIFLISLCITRNSLLGGGVQDSLPSLGGDVLINKYQGIKRFFPHAARQTSGNPLTQCTRLLHLKHGVRKHKMSRVARKTNNVFWSNSYMLIEFIINFQLSSKALCVHGEFQIRVDVLCKMKLNI